MIYIPSINPLAFESFNSVISPFVDGIDHPGGEMSATASMQWSDDSVMNLSDDTEVEFSS